MSGKTKSRLFYGYIIAGACFWIRFLAASMYYTFGVFFIPVSSEFGWTRAETSLASALSIFMVGLTSLFMGWLTDKLGPRAVIGIFGSFLGLAFLLLAHMTNLLQFQLIHMFLVSIGMSTASVPIMATVSRWFHKRRGMMSGLVQSGLGLGSFIISPLTGWVITNYDWRTAYTALGVMGLVGIFTAGLFLRKDPKDMGLMPDGESEAELTLNPSPLKPPPIRFTIRRITATPQFWAIGGLFFAFGFCRTTFATHIGPHVQDLGFTLTDAASVLAIINIFSVIARVGAGRFSDRIGVRKAMIIAYTAMVLDIAWGLYTQSLWGIYLFGVVFGFAWGAQAVLRYPAAVQAFGLGSVGLVMGIMSVFENTLGATIGAWLAGYIFDVVGDYSPVYWLGMAVALAGVILAMVNKPTVQPNARSSR